MDVHECDNNQGSREDAKKIKVRRHKNDCTWHDLGFMIGKIPPNIMFCKKKQIKKHVIDFEWMGVHEFTWVGWDSCMWWETKTKVTPESKRDVNSWEQQH